MSKRDLSFVIDVGTGSVRAALVDGTGKILSMQAREHEQIVPHYGWSEQRPADWWQGVMATARELLATQSDAAGRIMGVTTCGQMHGTVLLDDAGRLVRDSVPLWNDKRTADLVAEFEDENDIDALLPIAANPPTPAWPGFKLQWFQREEPATYERTATVLMPKDYINYRLTGERATDWTEGSTSYLMSMKDRNWSDELIRLLGLRSDLLPALFSPLDVIGSVTSQAAAETGLPEGLPVLAGAADFPVSLLGSGVHEPGMGSDVTGTSTIITVHGREPVLDARVSNVATIDGGWGGFVLLDSGGDAMRWARRAFHENSLSYEETSAKAGEAPAGSDGLFFLPYLSGERLGKHRNSRASFFGLTAQHGLDHLHRAVLEGVAFAAARNIAVMSHSANGLDQVVAAGGGARSELWLQIKASIYGCPILVPESAECGIIGGAAMLGAAVGPFNSAADAAGKLVHYQRLIEPNSEWQDRYYQMSDIFSRLYTAGQAFYDDLDALSHTTADKAYEA